MRSIPLMAATTVILAAAWACGGDGGGTGPDNDPVANFTGGPCTVAVPCSFADISTDPDGDNTITTRHWDFGDGTTVDNPGATPSHTYATAGSPTVTLTVTDNAGKSNTKSIQVTVSGGTTNTPPVAGFSGAVDLPGQLSLFLHRRQYRFRRDHRLLELELRRRHRGGCEPEPDPHLCRSRSLSGGAYRHG